MAHGRTIFAYLSHALSSKTSALSIMNSFIFQLTQEDHDLQASLCQLSRKNLKNDLTVSTDLVKALLQCAGPVYIVIDGLDEIDKIECDRLLEKLMEISGACGDVRILASSRLLDEIAARLQPSDSTMPRFEPIRIDNRNAGSIQAFVNHRLKVWFHERDFLDEQKGDIEALLAPLAANAKEMFLYAEVVIKTIWNLDLEEIRQELRVPPHDLDDAYSRILVRINRMPDGDATKARNILGWVGCSPSPLTIHEMEQALRIETGRSPRVSSRLNISRLCGPIVELIDEYIHFVHFTVKEYLFSPQISGFINFTEARLDLAKRCIWYLCQKHHDTLDAEDFDDSIASGDYRFHYYASTMWLELVENCFRNMSLASLPQELIAALEMLCQERSSGDCEDLDQVDVKKNAPPPGLRGLETEFPGLYRLLCAAFTFRHKCISSEFHIRKGEQWTVDDPLTTSIISRKLHQRLDELLCGSAGHDEQCKCPTLKRHYGARPFKCGFLGCAVRPYGFSMKSQRDKHERHHDRPWRCDEPSCEYANIGFLSRRMRDEHWQSHSRRQQSPQGPEAVEFDEDELQPLLFDLVRTNDVEQVEFLLPRLTEERERIIHFEDELFRLAAFSGSVPMVRLLYEKVFFERMTLGAVYASIRGNNIEGLRWLLSRTKPQDFGPASLEDWINTIIACESTEVFDICEQHLASTLRIMCVNAFRLKGWHGRIIKATAGKPCRENILLRFWAVSKELNPSAKYTYLDKRRAGQALGHIAETTQSIRLAQQLIEYGADANERVSEQFKPPLYKAVMKSSPKAAQYIKFLLYCGADPDAVRLGSSKQNGRTKEKNIVGRVRDQKGAIEIQKWLGLSWDELVDKVNKDLAKGIGWQGTD